MKLVIFILALLTVFIAGPVMADADSLAFFHKKDDCKDVRQELSDCGKKCVDLKAEVDNQKDKVGDAAAIGFVSGTFVGSGGLQMAAEVAGSVNPVFWVIGFLAWASQQEGVK